MALATLALPVKVTELKVLARPVSCGSGDILALGCFSETSELVWSCGGWTGNQLSINSGMTASEHNLLVFINMT